ncbi:MAG TPA: hypothetical protein VGS10_13775 [Terracidiphilus sp.]|nr:hypothetical protein [Terracidiphilus sp.]
MQNWFLPEITDYWDWTQGSLERFSLEIMMADPGSRAAMLGAIREAITEHVRVLPDRVLLDVLWVAADNLYKAGSHAAVGGGAIEMYLEASAGTMYSQAALRNCTLHYLVDNVFEQTEYGMKRPLELFEDWFRAAGLVYICPQLLAYSGPRILDQAIS